MNNILGWMTDYELLTIEMLAKQVPKNGVIVEIGSMFGRSSYCWATNCDPSVTVICIDVFPKEHIPNHNISEDICVINNYPFNGISYPLYEMFIENTKQFDNIKMIQAYSPNNITLPCDEIDIFFLDAEHQNPNDWENIKYFATKVKIGGILCGHDYRPEYPDVVENVNKLEKLLGCKAKIISDNSIWIIELNKKITKEILE